MIRIGQGGGWALAFIAALLGYTAPIERYTIIIMYVVAMIWVDTISFLPSQ